MVIEVALEKERLSRQLHAVTEVAKTLASPLELGHLLEAVMGKISGVVETADLGVLMLWDQSAGLFRARASFGWDIQILNEIGLRAGESITGKVFDSGEPLLVNDPEQVAFIMNDMREANQRIMARAIKKKALPTSILAAPLVSGSQKFGVLVLETLNGKGGFHPVDLPFVQTIADLVSLAIDRARLVARADAIREAQQAERLRSEVMATLSHQLRMPLSSIKGYSTALLMDEIEWDQKNRSEFLNSIVEECDSMEAMITELLDSSLIDVGQLSIELQPVRVNLLAKETVLEAQRLTDNHRFVVDFPAAFPIVDADPRWIRQVFRNIIDNSIKYSPQGGLIVVRGEVRPTSAVISISDQGVGISPEDLIPLFEKYFRVRTPNALRVPGTGLGLPVARAIVEAHGGRIWAESKVGEGTTLYFSLPAHSPTDDL